MTVYLVQHAKAAPKEVDPGRCLTAEGRQELARVAALIGRLDVKVDYLWHSGKTRAAQTAEVLSEVVAVRKETAVRDGLGPNDDVTVIRDEIISSRADVMIIGHLPFVGKLASLLLTGDASAGVLAFQQGCVVCVEQTTEAGWQVKWMITPELLA